MVSIRFLEYTERLLTTGLLVVAGCHTQGDGPPSSASEGTGGSLATCGFVAGGQDSTLRLPPATMTVAEWESAIAAQQLGHHVLGALCDQGEIGQDYAIVPNVTCLPVAEYDSVTNPVYACAARVGCTSNDDCKDGVLGTCTGFADSYCSYPGVSSAAPCSVDSDCSVLPAGQCDASQSCQILFYPDGVLRLPGGYCRYAEQPCETDADCTSAPQGTCSKVIRSTQCTYNECLEDADCSAQSRCYCYDRIEPKRCLPADCTSDADCSSGKVCRLEQTSCGESVAYHCSTATDSCTAPADCPWRSCRFGDAGWQCTDEPCLSD